MIWFVALMAVLFVILAVCTIGSMAVAGIHVGLAMAVAVLEITVGATIVKAMYNSASVR